ncbi:replicative DNA helicase [Novipirellula rosea]|uniref:DNA 5'-3' helicase n=1 Tax=Novipirellula rosea TaxID=1031540 RepID=A0ABP8MUT0_9BACT
MSDPERERDKDAALHDVDAERAVLGAVMTLPHLIDELAATLSADDFGNDANRVTFETFAAMHACGESIDDVALVASRFRAAGHYETVGGIRFFQRLIETGSAQHARHYAGIVRECSRRRHIVRVARSAITRAMATKADDNADSIIETLGASLRAIETGSAENEILTIQEVVSESLDRASRAKADESAAGIKTGIHSLDSRTGGMFAGLTVIVARPSMGKTALGFQSLANAARIGIPSLFVSIEMADWEVGNRFIAAETGTNSLLLRSGKVSDEKLADIRAFATNELSGMPLFFWRPKQRPTMERIAATVRMHALRHGTRLVAIDHLLKIKPSNPRDDRHEQVAHTITAAKDLASEMDIPLLMLAQAKRKDGAAKDRAPTVDEIYGSSVVEMEADDIWLVHREDRDATEGTIHIGKSRNGQVQTIDVGFDPVRTEFTAYIGGREF